MRLLLVHARTFKYKVTSPALENPEDLSGVAPEGTFSNALVVYTTVENGDMQVVRAAVDSVAEVVEKVKPSTVVIYPYAHLSSDLAPPHEALEVLRELEKGLRNSLGVGVVRAPFGWYKEFSLECYGHPLSELSRSLRAEGAAAQRVTRIQRKYYVLTPKGELLEPEKFDYSAYPDLRALVDKEVFGKELAGGESPVNEYCRKFGFEWEEMSDHGHMRYGPHAATIMEAVMKYSWEVAKSLGIPVFRVLGTNMFDVKHRAVYEHAQLFGDRLYELRVDNDVYILRYAACHQQFAMLKDWSISYKDLPFGIFEIADSYRLEQRGELALCFRLRRFFMPDLHIITRDLREAMNISYIVQAKIHEEARKVGRRYVALYNVTEDFMTNNFDYLASLVSREGYPALLSVIPGGIYYWVLNVEYHIIDALGRPREIATFQIDVGNSRRFGITFVDENGERKYPVIIHTALLGGVERYIYMVFDKAAQDAASGRTPSLPTWLSPTQVRVIPVSSEYLPYALDVAKKIQERGFRVDVDDRDETLGKKIRGAGREWVPYIVVVGEREVKTSTLNLRIRVTNEQRVVTVDELIDLLESEVRGYPKIDLMMPMTLSRRPVLNYAQF
ncbi:MAG: threonine--tRNA ligase [Desulfurococcaceae archaeon]